MFEIDTHKRVMVEVLLDIYRDSLLRNLLGFKGGTMAYLFYELPRMSVDLDFDLIDVTKKEEVFEKLKQILSKYKVIEEVDKKNCLFFLVDYGFDQIWVDAVRLRRFIDVFAEGFIVGQQEFLGRGHRAGGKACRSR